MPESFLIPENTVVSAKGDGASLDISAADNRVFLLTLLINRVVEQESLDVNIWGSADGAAWGEKSLAAFPQKFYRGEHSLLLDLSTRSDVKFLRAHWDVNRWGRGSETPMFEVQLTCKEVPASMLSEIRRNAGVAQPA